MRRFQLPVCLFLILSACPVAASILVEVLSESTIDCDDPAVARSLGEGDIVAWQDASGQVWTRFVGPFMPAGLASGPEPVNHGPGHSPKVAHTWFGFLVTWIEGSRIYYRYAGGQEFPDPAQFVDTGVDLSQAVLDVWGVSSAGYNVAWVVYEAPTGEVMLLRLTKGQPQGPLEIAPGSMIPALPQVTFTPGPVEPLARVYYLREDGSLAHRGETSYDEWYPEQVLPLPIYGSDFDVTGGQAGVQSVLSLGMQPTCPCNTIHATRQDAEGVWQDPEDLTVPHDAYNWPRSPCVRIDDSGRTWAFWMQITSGEDLQPAGRRLEYWRLDEAGWADRGSIFAGYQNDPGLGARVAMDIDDHGWPAFAWTVKDTVDGVPQPRRVMFGLIGPTAVGDNPVPARPLTIEAWPNPFNPALAIVGAAPAGTPATVAVHDLAGRRVRTLAIDAAPDGRFTARWDGRDDAGRAAPSGVYLLRACAGAQDVARRVVLAR